MYRGTLVHFFGHIGRTSLGTFGTLVRTSQAEKNVPRYIGTLVHFFGHLEIWKKIFHYGYSSISTSRFRKLLFSDNTLVNLRQSDLLYSYRFFLYAYFLSIKSPKRYISTFVQNFECRKKCTAVHGTLVRTTLVLRFSQKMY